MTVSHPNSLPPQHDCPHWKHGCRGLITGRFVTVAGSSFPGGLERFAEFFPIPVRIFRLYSADSARTCICRNTRA